MIDIHIIECCGCGLIYTDATDGTKDMPQPCPKCGSTKAKLLRRNKLCLQ